jgi:hypothetical protein
MPLSKTGASPGKRPHLPYKLAVMLLYGNVPGVTKLDSGRALVEVKKFADYFRSTSKYVKETAKTLESWGVLAELEIQSHTMLVQFADPRLLTHEDN